MEKTTFSVLLVEDNPGDARIVEEMLAGDEEHLFTVQRADSLLAALNALTQVDFDAALVDLSLPDSHGLETLTSIRSHAPVLPLVVLTGYDSDSAGFAAVEKGAQDFLVKQKLTTESLMRVLRYAVLRQKQAHPLGAPEARRARITGFLGAKGGVGTTTIACQYALEARRQSGRGTLLMDLDGSGAGIAFPLRLDTQYNLTDAATNLHRLDAEFWKRVVSSAPGDLDILAAPGVARHGDQISGERTRHVLRFARTLYSDIVIDLGRLNVTSLGLLDEIEDLYFVTSGEFPAIFEAARALRKLVEVGYSKDRIRVVLNRMDKAGITEQDVEAAVGYSIFFSVRDYSAELSTAYVNKRFAEPGLRIRRDISEMLAKAHGREVAAKPRTGLGRLRLIGT